ncbi:MAG: hypothetical protein AAF357_03185 [Verrucomicrobiota bacterium]
MNERQIACAILVLVVVGLAYGANKSYTGMVAAKQAAEESRAKALEASNAANVAKRALVDLKESTEDLRAFKDAWEPYVTAVRSPQATEQKVIDLIKSSDVFAVSQRFELLSQKNDPLIKQRLRAHVTIEDDYAKALNWMGALERELPVTRVNNCQVSRGDSGNDIRLRLVLDFPIVSTSA